MGQVLKIRQENPDHFLGQCLRDMISSKQVWHIGYQVRRSIRPEKNEYLINKCRHMTLKKEPNLAVLFSPLRLFFNLGDFSKNSLSKLGGY